VLHVSSATATITFIVTNKEERKRAKTTKAKSEGNRAQNGQTKLSSWEGRSWMGGGVHT
jgi:hypothetical protein